MNWLTWAIKKSNNIAKQQICFSRSSVFDDFLKKKKIMKHFCWGILQFIEKKNVIIVKIQGAT